MPSSLFDIEVSKVLAPRESSIIQAKIPDLKKQVSMPKPYPSPVDWRDCPIYFVLLDRFNNPNSDPRWQWDKAANDRQGGTFEGVRRQLSYIKDLGAGAIWLSPVLKNVQFHEDYNKYGYGIMDFLEIDPRFGTSSELAEAEFDALINEAHARGLYVILDVVINHAANLFAYDVNGQKWDSAPWRKQPYEKIYWRDENGIPSTESNSLPSDIKKSEGIWPREFQNSQWFRRQGMEQAGQETTQGDFDTLKEFKTELPDNYDDRPVRNLLIRAYQYIIARFDIDAFRVDTIKHVEREFALTFSNAMRELAFSIGKKNFFIFGEARTDDEKILAEYTGRYTSEKDQIIGADAVLDFPLRDNLVQAAKGFAAPTVVKEVFDLRKEVYKDVLSTHGEASRFFVTFLDNHDDPNRFLYPRYGGDYTSQLTMALGCLFCLQGIPCIYYGTEQGLKGTGELYAPNYDPANSRFEFVREAMWGKPEAFNQNSKLYQDVRRIAQLRIHEPALRYGRQYFRQVSGNGVDFGFSGEKGGIISFSRVLNGREIVIVANTSVVESFSGWVLVDSRINADNTQFRIAYSNFGTTGNASIAGKEARIWKEDSTFYDGWARRIQVKLAPTEIQVYANE